MKNPTNKAEKQKEEDEGTYLSWNVLSLSLSLSLLFSISIPIYSSTCSPSGVHTLDNSSLFLSVWQYTWLRYTVTAS